MSSALFIPCPARRFDARILGMSVLIVSFANFARSCFRRGRRAGDIEGVSISNVRLHRKIRIVLSQKRESSTAGSRTVKYHRRVSCI